MADAIASRAAVDFVLTLRRRWADTLYPHVRREYEAAAGPVAAAPESIAPAVHALPAWPWFAWLERGSQKMLWRAVGDSLASTGLPEDGAMPPATLELDPGLALPSWYTDWDIHLQPGGVWSRPESGAVYELGAKLVMLGENDDYAFHRLFTASAIPEPGPAADYRRIVDLGCGFGKSTWPLKQRFPEAEVIGVDLAAPCLRLAARRAGERGLAVRFRQADACATGLEAGSVDLVTSTMFAHEVPAEVLPAVFAEAARLLAPGGRLRFLDFQLTGDAFRDLAMLEHGERNNEPYLPPMLRADLVAMATDAGLAGARWVGFDERGGGRRATLDWPQRGEWHFPWAVLEAERPR